MTTLGTLWRTVRHLKLGQLVGRVAFRLRRPKPRLAPAPARRRWAGPWTLPAARRRSLVGPQQFRFLGVDGELAELGWCGQGAEKLWRYNQHYFDDLNALGADHRRNWHTELLERWLAGNPPAAGDGWEPYPTSLRICNWLKASASGLALPPAAWHSLAVQARWLTQRLEWHLLGNHLFVNAKALVLAGLAFEGGESAAWLAKGLAILREQLPEQVLSDGGQFERSPMYHALALEDLLDLINVAQASQAPEVADDLVIWRMAAAKMLHWLRVMTHPDGRLARFNDSADGIAPANQELERYAAALGVGAANAGALIWPQAGAASNTGTKPPALIHLLASGYIRADWGPAAAFLDVAPVGPDYLPGHAHADTLSFELSLRGQLLVVNGGTSCYGSSARRLQERGTAAKSTLQVAGLNSSEVWSSFRVGRRARPIDVQVSATQVSASHDGYLWLPGAPLHSRAWRFLDGGLEVEDLVSAPEVPATARYHLAPAFRLQLIGHRVWQVMAGGEPWARVEVMHGRGSLEVSTFAPEFGVVLLTQCLAVDCEGGRALTRWTWHETDPKMSTCTSSF
jgi:uncharacterized heparinase superfamily protein